MFALMKMLVLPGMLGGGRRSVNLYTLSSMPRSDLDTIAQWMVEGKARTVIEDENRFDLADVSKPGNILVAMPRCKHCDCHAQTQ